MNYLFTIVEFLMGAWVSNSETNKQINCISRNQMLDLSLPEKEAYKQIGGRPMNPIFFFESYFSREDSEITV